MHVELASGQIWDRPDCGDRWTLTTQVTGGPFAGQWNAVDRDGGAGIIGPEDVTMTRSVLLNVPAAAPLAADRTKCHPDCGKSFEEYDRSSARPMCVTHQTAHDKAAKIAYCAPACRDARLPPLVAQPAEAGTRCCEADGCDVTITRGARCYKHMTMAPPVCCPKAWNRVGHNDWCKVAKPAPQPAPAKPHDFSDPYCATSVGPLCVACGATEGDAETCKPRRGWRIDWEATLMAQGVGYVATGILRDPAIPERIERPKLAHSYGVECPALEDA